MRGMPGCRPQQGSCRNTIGPAGSLRTSADVSGRLHLPQLLLEVGKLVAQSRGQLELELSGRLEHLLVEVGDDRFELAGAGRSDALATQVRGGRTLATVASGQQGRRVGTLASQGFGDVADAL